MSDITLHRVIVTLTLTDRPGDEAEIISLDFEGEPTTLTALGMLHMAADSLLHGPDEEDDE